MTVKDWMTYDENGNYVENLGVLQQHIRDYVQTLGEEIYTNIWNKKNFHKHLYRRAGNWYPGGKLMDILLT